MLIEIFTINPLDSETELKCLNSFLSSHVVLAMRKEVVSIDGCDYWSFLVEYSVNGGGSSGRTSRSSVNHKKKSVDYREVLDELQFTTFSKLKDLRKKIADREAIPVYGVFNNAQLASFVTDRVTSLTAMKKVDGVGESKITKYGEAFLNLLKQIMVDSDEADGESL